MAIEKDRSLESWIWDAACSIRGAKDGDFFISDWLRNRNTAESLGIWETVHNLDFNSGEFAIIKSQAGLNSYKLSVKEWVEKTNAIGLRATAGRYGGTYAHHDIAFEFGMWISPEFKICLIKEFQRLKEDENRRLSLAWNFNRTLAKINYRIHTDAIQNHLIPAEVTAKQAAITYANEDDLLNVALFGRECQTERGHSCPRIRIQWRVGKPALRCVAGNSGEDRGMSVSNTDWQSRPLGELSTTTSGGTPSCTRKDHYNGSILYLLMDEDDTRPLLIDQPVGNLDNSSVYKQLVPYITKAKKRRQTILITHNPNLVVATDAEEIISATAERPNTQPYPCLRYDSGALEHSVSGTDLGVREAVCLLLEGGEEAFRARENRHSLVQV